MQRLSLCNSMHLKHRVMGPGSGIVAMLSGWIAIAVVGLGTSSGQSLDELADGQRDATEAIQAALNESHGFVELPPGKFRISRPLVIHLPDDGPFELRGRATSTLQMFGPGPAIRIEGTHFKSADPAGFSEQIWQAERMPTLQGIAIEGKHAQADGIEAVGTMQLTLSRLHIRKVRHGVRLVENNRNILFANCHIYECSGVGILYDDVNLHQSNIIGCHVSYCGGGGIVSRGGNVRNIHITGCDIEGNMSPDQDPTANILIDCRGSEYGTAEVAITGCTIQHSDAAAGSANIRIIGQSDPTVGGVSNREGNITISGNVLSDVKTNVHLESCRGVTLTGNTFWMGFEHNLLVTKSSHIIMGPNNFDRNPRYAYGHSQDAKNRILIQDCEDCTLVGIHISDINHDQPAVTLQRCQRMNVSALTILDSEIGLYLDDVSSSVFTGCLIRNSRSSDRAQRLVVAGGFDNIFDASLQP
ncbi:MAG: right-handed parallel beta-helix repeat-containing protein [Planctomycetales bacterium]|nr:right-handed parallel beta-helix repeat-containing protein [Planctomycetales bacterium]